MKKKIVEDDPLDREIDFSNARRNPWFLEVVGPHYVRVLDKDLADLFPDHASVNAALRSIAAIAARMPVPPQNVGTRRMTAPTSKIADAPRRPKKEGS